MVTSNVQDARIGRFVTPLGPDKLVLSRFNGSEGLNELFEFRVEALAKIMPGSSALDIDFAAIIGRNCTLTVQTIDNRQRHIDGICVEMAWSGVRHDNYVYELVLKPWLYLMSFRTDCFIFHEMTAPEIIAKVFGRHGFANHASKLTRSYPKLEYCVQYRESDMNFVRRLMEQHGINFYFQHQEGEHKLVLCDDYSSYEKIPGGQRPFIPYELQHRRNTEHFHSWYPERRFTSGRVMLNDYDFKRPSADMKADSSDNPDFANGALEIYDYPGGYTDTSAGIDYARAWLEGLRAADNRIRAAGDCVSASPGALVTLKDHPIASQNEEYLILRCHHNFTTQDYRSEMQIEGEPPYDGTYELLRADQPVSPPVVTPRPRVHGAQTAKVVGQDEIDVDEHGRIKVQFHWDRKNDYSRRVRLAQVWAGNQWGAMFIPRVGMEVVVDFLEGDPDHPLVIGTVYNGQNKPPYDLPGQKNTAGWKSNSTIGGGGYNEYVFDDTKGQELIRQHGQKDLESVVENDESWTIGRNRSTTIGNNESRSVGNNRRTTIGNSDTLEVGTSLTIKAGSKVTIEVGGPGGSKITITPVSITMESLEIRAKATARFSTTTVLSEHSAAALMDIKGALVKINS